MSELKAVLSATKAVPIDLGGTTVTVNYRPSIHTRTWLRSRNERQKKVLERLLEIQRVASKAEAGGDLTKDERSVWEALESGAVFDGDETEILAQQAVELLDPENPWDLTDEGEPVKPTIALFVDTLGYTLTSQIVTAIMQDINPSLREQSPNGSTASSG